MCAMRIKGPLGQQMQIPAYTEPIIICIEQINRPHGDNQNAQTSTDKDNSSADRVLRLHRGLRIGQRPRFRRLAWDRKLSPPSSQWRGKEGGNVTGWRPTRWTRLWAGLGTIFTRARTLLGLICNGPCVFLLFSSASF